MKTVLSRRTILRGLVGGAGVGLTLPALEAALDANGTAYADGTPLPKRFGVWFWGCGIIPDLWIPKSAGPRWQPSRLLAPLAALNDQVSVVTNLASKGGASHGAVTTSLTGRFSYLLGYTLPSIDQVVASAWAGQTSIPSLQVGVSKAHGNGEFLWEHISYSAPRSYNAAEFNPARVFDRLFASSLGGGADPAETRKIQAARKSVLDAVVAGAGRLKARLGAPDRRRIDQHLDGVRSVEMRIANLKPLTCVRPARPADDPLPAREDLEPRNRIMSDLVAIALACDITRVFSVLFSRPECETVFWQVGAKDAYHPFTHTSGDSPIIPAVMEFTMKQFATFVEAFRQTPDGAGTLLDNSCIFGTSEVADPRAHSVNEFPALVAGGAGGKLRPGQHVRLPAEDTIARLHLTMLRGLDLPVTSFGRGPDYTEKTIPDLLA